MIRAHALLTIAASPNGDHVLNQVTCALSEPEKWPELLRSLAAQPDTGASLLAPASTVAAIVAEVPQNYGLALLYRATAAADAAQNEDAARFAREAVAATPEERMRWIALLAELGSTNPAVLTLIPYLTEERTS